MGLFKSTFKAIRKGLTRTREALGSGLRGMLLGKTLSESLIDDIETHLITSDVGVQTTAAIIDELDLCLDMDAGVDIAVNLRSLYGFVRRHLTQACARKDGEAIREVIRILEELNEGWKAITA